MNLSSLVEVPTASATAADFRKRLSMDDAYEPPEAVTLPKCGLTVILRRPRPLAYTLLGIALPASLVFEEEGPDGPATQPGVAVLPETLLQISRWTVRLMQHVFVKPRLALAPGLDEISPLWIPFEDQKFILAWTRGEVTSSGESLQTFCDETKGGAGAAGPAGDAL